MGAELSGRERQCLELAGQGLSAKEISRAVGDITDQTVETYLKRARRKLGVSTSLAGAHALTGRTDLLDVPPNAVAAMPSRRLSGSADRASLGGIGDLFLRLFDWLPLRRAGERHNVLTTGQIFGWIVRLTLIGTVTISIAAAAMAMIGFIWFQGANRLPH